MSNLTILNTTIRTFNNLYSLTDLHRTSGGENKHKPALFLRLDQTKDLITEIEKNRSSDLMIAPNTELQICNSVKVIHGGLNSGTYACKELVIAYAAWISPTFHLIVLRAFLNQMENAQQQLALPEPEPTITIELKISELKKLLSVWLQFTRFEESVYFLIRALGLNPDSYHFDERSVVFNHGLCKKNIKDTLQLMKRLSAYIPLEPKRLGKF